MANKNTPYPQSGAPKAREQQQQKVNLDLSLGTDITCDKCKGYTFHEVVFLKHFSELVSPTGKAGNLPMPSFACNHCGWVNDGFIPVGYFAKKPDAPTAPENETEPVKKQPSIEIVR